VARFWADAPSAPRWSRENRRTTACGPQRVR
jgi:hypothetical protein